MNGRKSQPTNIPARADPRLSRGDAPFHRGLSHEQRRELSATLDAVREEQRAALARDVHDVLGGMLTSIKMDVSRIIRRAVLLEAADITAMATDVVALVQETIDAARRLSDELRPNVVSTAGLSAAIRHELVRFANRHGLEASLVVEGDDTPLPAECTTHCYRIVQEALTNVARHASATSVNVRMVSAGGTLSIEVVDDGCGIDPAALPAHSAGMLGMSERADKLGGTLRVRPGEHAGTLVSLTLPVAPPRDELR